MKKRKYLIGGLICFLLIGFAAIATTLILNGNVNIGFNESDFGIYFSKSILDLTDVSKETISSDGQTIDFNATLTEVNKATELDYEVTNSSKNYDAKVSIECSFQNEGSTINFDELVSMEYLNNEDIIPARSKGTGHVSLKLKKAITEDITTKLKCNLNFEPVEREELGETSDDINNNSLSGYLIDENRKLLPNKNLVVLKDENAYITTNEEAFLTIAGLDVDIYDIYIIENKTIDEIKNMTNDQIKDIALTKAKFTHSSKEITFDNGYKIVNELDKHTVNFDPNGGSVSSAKKEVVYKKPYGELPKPTRDNYVFIGWYTDRDAGDEITSTTKVETNEDHTLYAHWEISDLLVDVVSNLAKTDTTNLSYDETNENNIRYIGTNPSNYVSFNGELWRIIGVMNDVEDSTGTVARHAKIIKEEKIPSMSYDNTATLSGSGINDWSKSSLQEVLNSGAYWNRTSGTCPAGSNGYTSTCDYTGTGLKNDAKKMISNVVWKLGAIQGATTTTRDFYNDERGTKVPDNHATRWTGKVGLMYPSDYGYAVGGDVREEALLTPLTNYETEDGVSFADYNWLKYDSSEWTITPSLTETFLTFYKSANLATASATSNYFVRPSLHLGSYIKVVDGDGTRENPYILAINNNVRYKVNFDSNGGTKVDTVLTVRNGEKYGTLPTVERDNLVFEGWYTEKTGGTKVTSTTTVDIGDNQTLYAHWTIRGVLNDGISELSKTDTTNLSHDNTSENNLRYIGTNPNNYVSFNGELWRIIGVMNDVEDATGITASHVKIIREEGIPNYYPYDNKPTPPNNYGSNDWSTSTLQKMLNSGPYWNRTSGKCPAGSNGYTTSCDFSDIGLKTDAKKMISNVTWKLGGADNPGLTPSAFYEAERGNNVPSNHETKWIGKVGLMYASDYGYSVDDTDKKSSKMALGGYGQYDNANWLRYTNNEYTITPVSNTDYLSFYKSSGLNIQPSSYTLTIRPSVYLNSYTEVTDGDGSRNNPYKLALNTDRNYVVAFDATGGEKVNTVLTVKNNTSYGELPTTSKEGFEFEGWFTEKGGGTQITSESIVDIADNQLLYAHWALRGILKDGIEEIAKTDKTNLTEDKTSDNNTRYIGADPNNYVKFNDELWRIIGVMNNIEDSTGIKDSHVKIIRADSIGIYSYDNKPSGVGSSVSSDGSNNWSDARLMTTLNSGPYWNRTSGTCYKGSSYNGGTVNCDFSDNGLTSEAKRMISNVVWNLGGFSSNSTSAPSNYFYEAEKGTYVFGNHQAKWTGKVGLMYASDYKYAENAGNWLYKEGINHWTITPTSDYGHNEFITYSGNISTTYTSQSSYGDVLPTVYLAPNTRVVGGKGTHDEPYELAINENTEYTYTVNFDANGGEEVNTVLTVTYGSNYGELPIPTRENYHFDGWYTEVDGGTQITRDSVVDVADNQTLHAHWTVNGLLKDVIKGLEEINDTNLAKDGTTDDNIRYIGADPNNYVKFNGELWRIIGVMNNIEDSTGIKDRHVKIIRPQPIGNYSWDNKGYNGSNDWSDAKLMEVLNNDGPYWNSTKGKCPTGSNGQTSDCDFTDIGLTARAKSMISNVVWNIAGSNTSSSYTSAFYTAERGTNPSNGHAATWTGSVGLMYASDFGYAVGGSVRNTCLSKTLDRYGGDYCYDNDWLNFKGFTQWTLTPYSYNTSNVFYLGSSYADLYSSYASNSYSVNPTVYLDTNTKAVGGSGTSEDPYILELKNSSLPNPSTYIVDFDANEGEEVNTVLTVTTDEYYGELPTTQRKGYTFNGWYTERDGGTQVTNTTRVRLTNNQTLYAHWTKNIYKVNIYAQIGGKVDKANLDVEFGGNNTFKVTPDNGYYLSNISCTNGYTANANIGNDQTSEQDVVISDNESADNSECIIHYELSSPSNNLLKYVGSLANTDEQNIDYDKTNNNNLRYTGLTPNNYIAFNGELWRIIGIMRDVTDNDENVKNYIKIIRDQSIGSIVYDTNNVNDWSTSSLKETLNNGEYWNRGIGICYANTSSKTLEPYSCSFENIGLTDIAKSMISSVVWKLGGLQYYSSYTTSKLYEAERGTSVYSGHAKQWTGNIGLIYPSDYGYAFGGENRNTCLTKTITSSYNMDDCKNNNWLLTDENYWTITPAANYYPEEEFDINSEGYVSHNDAQYSRGVRPALYLNPDITKVGGTGTKSDPYLIALNEISEPLLHTYTVSFDANGGKEEPTILTVTEGKKYGELPTSIRNGYTFIGWFTEKDGGTQITKDSIVDIIDNQILYAHWKIDTTSEYEGSLITHIRGLGKTDKTNLSYDGTNNNNLRYIGANPNNYVKYNNELWRIIGIMNDVKDSNEKTASRVKIIRATSVGNYVYDNSGYDGNNDWSKSKLMDMLNNGPYWNRTIGKCPRGRNNATVDCNFINTGLTNTAKGMISNIVWNLGTYEDYSQSASESYIIERGNTVCEGNPAEWTGYVGLMYPSDYGYAVGGSVRNTCLGQKVSAYGTSNCYNYDWLQLSSDDIWTISPYHINSESIIIYKNGGTYINYVNDFNTYAGINVYPSVYLKTNIDKIGGTGTETDPYLIELGGTYTVSFDSNGGNPENTVLTVTVGEKYGTLPIPEREYYDFDGWYTTADGGTKITEDTIVNINGDTTLYAHWKKKIIPAEPGNLVNSIKDLAEKDPIIMLSDETSENNLRYVGANPNNYVKFNCTEPTDGSEPTCELWRIIGVMNDVTDSKGNTRSFVKIVRDESIGTFSWDNKKSGVGSSTTDYGSNDWSDAMLMTTLNEGPYWNRTSGKCYTAPYSQTTCDFSNNGLLDNTKNMISNVIWKIGGSPIPRGTSSNKINFNTTQLYTHERGIEEAANHATEWTGNVGLIYLSDFGYAVGGENRSTCLLNNLGDYNTSNCANYNWMYNSNGGGNQWTLSHNSTNTIDVFQVQSMAYKSYAYMTALVRPTVYLNPDIELVSGKGTKDDPYTLQLNTIHTVSFDANGGSAVNTVLTVVEGRKYGTLPVSERDGYEFKGWYTTADGEEEVTEDTEVSITDDHTLYAHWRKLNTYTVNFDANGGNEVTTILTVTESKKFGKLPRAKRDEYGFDGWYTEADGGTQITADTIVDITDNITLYAHWAELGSTLMARSNKAFWNYDASITRIVFETTMLPKENAKYSYDVSEQQNGSVMAYMIENKAYDYTLYIQSEGRVRANANSEGLFQYFKKLESIDNLKDFDTSNVTNMSHMFENCYKLTSLDLSNFDTSKVTDMSNMFYTISSTIKNLDLRSFDTSKVTDMSMMFYSSYLTSVDLSSFDTSSVTDMSNMFSHCQRLTSLDLSSFDTSNVTDMSRMFNNCSALTSLDLSIFDPSNVTDMSYMFHLCTSLATLNVSRFNTPKVTSMSSMFEECKKLISLDLSSFNTSNVTNMSKMFLNCASLTTIDLSSFNTSNVTDMSEMFDSCQTLTSLDLSSFNTSNVTNMYSMFSYCHRLTSLDLSNFNTSNVTNMSMMFIRCYSLKELNLSSFNTSNVTNMYSMFARCFDLRSIDVSSFDTSNVTIMSSMFDMGTNEEYVTPPWYGESPYTKLTEIKGLENFNTSKVTSMSSMFAGCNKLISLNVSNFNTSNVTDMDSMFSNCASLTALSVSNFNTSKVTSMSSMFAGCNKITSLNVSNFNTSNVTSMAGMFASCQTLTSLDISSFNTSKVTSMGSMFAGCNKITSLNLSNFDTSNVTNMYRMFSYCASLTSLDLSNFNTSKVTRMAYMFSHCTSLINLDLSSFDTSNVTDFAYMFEYDSELASITYGDNFIHKTNASYTNMFLLASKANRPTHSSWEGLSL